MPVLVPVWVAGVVAGDLAVLLGSPRVAALPLANFCPAYQVAINIQRFEPVPGKSVTGNDYDALAAAHSRALAKVSRNIATVIRAEADVK